jgi:hypothetical protein
MAQTYVDTEVSISGNTKTTTKTTYTCTEEGFAYTIIGEDIKADFDFLKSDNAIGQKLDEMLSYIKSAADIDDAFYFENGSSVFDILHAYEELKKDVEDNKKCLDTLHSAYIKAIDNVNAELKTNFGYWAGYKVNKAGRSVKTEEIE